MNKVYGIILIIIAILLFIGVYVCAFKKGIYKGDFLSLIIDSIEFLIFIGALVILGITFLVKDS